MSLQSIFIRNFVFLVVSWFAYVCYLQLANGSAGPASSKVADEAIPTADPTGPISEFSDLVVQSTKTPVFFVSHGAPTFLYRDAEWGGDSAAWDTAREIGRRIVSELKPSYIIVVSAHWQQKRSATTDVSISVPDLGAEHKLIYDFSGFPPELYREEFHANGSLEVAQQIQLSLKNEGISSSIESRGLDHGAWVPLKIAFSDSLKIPLIQVSLGSDDRNFQLHDKLGKALNPFRSTGGLVIASGMAVHNLYELGIPGPFPYVEKLLNELETIITLPDQTQRFAELQNLKLNPLLKKGHPTLEHFLPIIVASSAAGNDKGKQLYKNGKDTGSLGWALYEFTSL